MEPSFLILTLANVMAILPLVPTLDIERQYDVEELAELLARTSSQLLTTLAPELFVSEVLLAHALHLFKTVLENKYQWVVQVSKHTKNKVIGFGEIDSMDKRYTVKFPRKDYQASDNDYAHAIYEKRQKHIQNLMFQKYRQRGVYLHDKAVDLRELCNPKLCLDLLFRLHRERCCPSTTAIMTSGKLDDTSVFSAVSDIATPTVAITDVAEVTSIPVERQLGVLDSRKRKVEVVQMVEVHQNATVTHRDRIMQGRHMYSDEMKRMAKVLKENKQDTSKHYIEHFESPHFEARRDAVVQHAPHLYTAIFDAMLSENHVVDSVRNAKKIKLNGGSQAEFKASSHMDEKAAKTMRMAVTMCELITSIHSGGSVLTNAKVELSVILYFGGSTRRAFDLLSARGFDMFTENEWIDIVEVVYKFIAQGHRAAGTAYTYKDKKSTAINYARCLYLAQVLAGAARDVTIPATATWPARLVLDAVQNGLDNLGIHPVAKIVLEGSGVEFIEKLHLMTQYLAFCRRDKVVRSLLTNAAALLHVVEKRPDLMQIVLKNVTMLNDQIVELHNAQTQRNLPQNAMMTPALVGRAAQISEAKRDFFSPQEHAHGTASPSSSKGRGEVYKDEVKHNKEKGLLEQARTKNWLLKWLAKLDKLGARRQEEASRATDSALFSVEACLSVGRKRIESEIMPKYVAYLRNEKRKAEKLPHRESENGDETADDSEDHKCVSKMNVPVLKAYLRYRRVACSQWNKPALIQRILQDEDGKSQLMRFVVQYQIHTDDIAKEFVRNLSSTHEVVEQQQQQSEDASRAEQM